MVSQNTKTSNSNAVEHQSVDVKPVKKRKKIRCKPRSTCQKNSKLDLVRVCEIDTALINPSPENDSLYRPVDPSDPEIIELAKSIRKHGVKEPLVISLDHFILSGHRRYCAAKLLKLKTVPCRIESIEHNKDPDRFITLLREFNRQRDKTFDEKLREEIVSADPIEAYKSLIEYRQEQSGVGCNGAIELREYKGRCQISNAKFPMMAVVKSVLNGLSEYWPISVRKVHYGLLNDPPLRHASKPKSVYKNDKHSYRSLVDLLGRLRLLGEVPWNAINDETRPVTNWCVYNDCRGFIRMKIGNLLKGYWRNLQQSQPNHIEILGEKNTLLPILKPIAMEFCIPITAGRGFCSLPPRYEMAQRYEKSGKDKLILLIVSDFDPDGEEIAHSYARSMRDDFDVDIHPIKVALTKDQAAEYDLPNALDAKKSSSNYKRFAEKFGDDSWEVEALDPSILQDLLRESIDSVLDTDLFNAEIDAERDDAAHLQGVRNKVHSILGEVDGGLLG